MKRIENIKMNAKYENVVWADDKIQGITMQQDETCYFTLYCKSLQIPPAGGWNVATTDTLKNRLQLLDKLKDTLDHLFLESGEFDTLKDALKTFGINSTSTEALNFLIYLNDLPDVDLNKLILADAELTG